VIQGCVKTNVFDATLQNLSKGDQDEQHSFGSVWWWCKMRLASGGVVVPA